MIYKYILANNNTKQVTGKSSAECKATKTRELLHWGRFTVKYIANT